MRYVLWLLCLGLLTGVGYVAGIAQGQSTAPPPTADKNLSALDVQSAQLYRDLARLDYEKVLDANKLVPGVISRDTLGVLQGSLIFAEVRYQQAIEQSQGKPVDQAAYFERVAQSAAASYDAALKSPRFAANEYKLELERLRLFAELAKVRLEKAREITSRPPIEQLAWRVDMVQEEIALISQQVTRLLVQPGR